MKSIDLKVYKHFSFDLDGTIVDSIPVMRLVWQDAVDKFFLSRSFESYQKNLGFPFKEILTKMDITDSQEAIHDFYFSRSRELLSSIQTFPNIDIVFTKLKERGALLSLVTSKNSSAARELINHMGLDFDVVVCADEVARGKPYPDSMEVVFESLGADVSPSETIYFGDTIVDLQFAINCNVDYCHCAFSDRVLSNMLVPTPRFIRSWSDLLEGLSLLDFDRSEA